VAVVRVISFDVAAVNAVYQLQSADVMRRLTAGIRFGNHVYAVKNERRLLAVDGSRCSQSSGIGFQPRLCLLKNVQKGADKSQKRARKVKKQLEKVKYSLTGNKLSCAEGFVLQFSSLK